MIIILIILTGRAFPGKCQITSVSKSCENDIMKVVYRTDMKITAAQLDVAKQKSREIQNSNPNFMRQTVIVAKPP